MRAERWLRFWFIWQTESDTHSSEGRKRQPQTVWHFRLCGEAVWPQTFPQITDASIETTPGIFQYSPLIPDRMYENDWEVSAPGVHLVLSPITVRQRAANGEAYQCARSVCGSQLPPPQDYLIPHPSCFFALPLMNNQCWSQYCRYEINLLPAEHRVMLLQENQCPPCCSLGLDRVYAHLLS